MISGYYTKTQVDSYVNALNDDVALLFTVVSPYEPEGNQYSFLNVPTSTIPLCVRNSDKTEQIVNFYDSNIVFYKPVVFSPDCTFSGANAPYTITQVDAIVSQLNTRFDLYYTKIDSDNRYFTKTYVNDLIALYFSKVESDARYHTKTYVDDLIALYYTKTESDDLYYLKAHIDANIYTKTQSDINFYNKNYIDSSLYLKTEVFNKTEINQKFLPFTTAFTLGSGSGYYYNLPASENGIVIWDAVNETSKVQFKSNLSKFFTDVEMTGDLKVDTLSGDVLTQIDAFVKTKY